MIETVEIAPFIFAPGLAQSLAKEFGLDEYVLREIILRHLGVEYPSPP